MSSIPEFKKGDIFFTRSESGFLGRTIRGITSFWSSDGSAVYNHAGILTSATDTFECLARIGHYKLSRYSGGRVMVARPHAANDIKEKVIADIVERYDGKIYPAWRLALHLVPPFARLVNRASWPVCSELVAMYLQKIGVRDYPWSGTSPDRLADEVWRWRAYVVLFDGPLP